MVYVFQQEEGRITKGETRSKSFAEHQKTLKILELALKAEPQKAARDAKLCVWGGMGGKDEKTGRMAPVILSSKSAL